MSKKKSIFLLICAALAVCLNVLIFQYRTPASAVFQLHMEVEADHADTVQVYHSEDTEFQEESSVTAAYTEAGSVQELVFDVNSFDTMIRLDLGQEPGNFEIKGMYLQYQDHQSVIPLTVLQDYEAASQTVVTESASGAVQVQTDGSDPYLIFRIDMSELDSVLQDQTRSDSGQILRNVLLLAVMDVLLLMLIVFRKKLLSLPAELLQNRRLIMKLSINDFKTKYAGSYLGIIWAFIQPIVTIMVYWFVFSVGLKAGNAQDYPFVLYLTSGIVPWFFFQDALNGGTNAMLEYSYLVKKVVFKISIIPIVKIISALFVHIFFVAFALVMCCAYGYYPSLYSLQLIYYSACAFILTLGIVYATSAVVIFFRDLTQIISIVLQVGVWLTPIMWDIHSVLAEYPLLIKIFKLNPMYYIVTGYRDSMLGRISILEHLSWGVYFWIVTAALFGVGTLIFKRLKPHFADVL